MLWAVRSSPLYIDEFEGRAVYESNESRIDRLARAAALQLIKATAMTAFAPDWGFGFLVPMQVTFSHATGVGSTRLGTCRELGVSYRFCWRCVRMHETPHNARYQHRLPIFRSMQPTALQSKFSLNMLPLGNRNFFFPKYPFSRVFLLLLHHQSFELIALETKRNAIILRQDGDQIKQ